jgi:hypothetical protein
MFVNRQELEAFGKLLSLEKLSQVTLIVVQEFLFVFAVLV